MAQLNSPAAVAVDIDGNLYITDEGNNRVRKVDHITGNILTIAGNGVAGYSGDNMLAITASINFPIGICIDELGNLYIGDRLNFVVRKIAASGIISTYAGSNINGYSGDLGPATSAMLSSIYGLTCDRNNNLYIVDGTRIRKVDAVTQIITTIAGNGMNTYNGDGIPATDAALWLPFAVCVAKNGNVFIADQDNNRIRQISSSGIIQTIAGIGTSGFSGDNGTAALAEIFYPQGVALDTCGNLLIADEANNRIRKIAFNPTCATLDVLKIFDARNLISIHPNPTQNNITITAQNITSITITNLLAKEVFTKNYNNAASTQIDIHYLPPGVYVVKVNGCYVQKLVKE